MPKPTKGARLGGSASHQRIILSNLATQLFEHGKITTTEAKAKRLRPLAEKLITKAKRGDIHSRRLVLTTVRDKGVVHALFTEIAPTFTEREGGYTRITKVGPRKGDNAPMALIELVTESVADSKKANDRSSAPVKKAPAAKKSTPASSTGSTASATPVGSTTPGATAADDSTVEDSPQVDIEAPVEESPAEELVSDTEERDTVTEEQVAPSDGTSDEEAAGPGSKA